MRFNPLKVVLLAFISWTIYSCLIAPILAVCALMALLRTFL